MPPRQGGQFPEPSGSLFPVYMPRNPVLQTPAPVQRIVFEQNLTEQDFSMQIDSDGEVPSTTNNPPVLVSPIKTRRVRDSINKMPDLKAWNLSDKEIIDAALATWSAPCYEHYDITLHRDLATKTMHYIFTCKDHPENHPNPIVRARQHTSTGTSNLNKDVRQCHQKLGIEGGLISKKARKQAEPAIPYSEANHRALIALRIAKYARPVNMVADEEYKAEVDMLRPGTIIPSPNTVQRDLVGIYSAMSASARNYFMGLSGMIHLVLDGWTAPLISSYLGLVIIWCDKGISHRAILEFIRLKNKHTGEYMAQVVSECVKRWGLDQKLLGICMDNAANCNKMAELLQSNKDFLPLFWGQHARLRCFAHIINLVAKVFISFFFKKPKLRKSDKVASVENEEPIASQVDEGDVEDNSDDEDNLAAFEEAIADSDQQEEDDGQIAHDQEVVRSIRDLAIHEMAQRSVYMTAGEEKEALKLFPAVMFAFYNQAYTEASPQAAGLARKVHDSPTLNERFQEILEKHDLETNKTSLTRRVPTRWNSDFDCLTTHLEFQPVVEHMTSLSSLKLAPYRLSNKQWLLADDVKQVLELFKTLTLIFSKPDIPMVVEVLPQLYILKRNLESVVNDTPSDSYIAENPTLRSTPSVVRIAAHASVQVIDKYINLIWDCDLYVIAMVMCPDRKLRYFQDVLNYNKKQLGRIKGMVVDTWTEHYLQIESDEVIRPVHKKQKPTSKWDTTEADLGGEGDHIDVYLQEPQISKQVIKGAGGYLQYWQRELARWPLVSQMGLDFCSAPATSVDAERAFSTGRRHVSFTQHNMTSQTFKAWVAVGSWAKIPALCNFQNISQTILETISRQSEEDNNQ